MVEWLRFLREKKPRFAIYENVKNIVGSRFKETFDKFVAELEEYGKVEAAPKLEGKKMIVVLAPKK